MDYGIYTTQGKKTLLGNRATVNGRDAIAYVKNTQGGIDRLFLCPNGQERTRLCRM